MGIWFACTLSRGWYTWDGPQCGSVMTLAILSQLTNIPIRNNVGMTGEIDLNGTIRAIEDYK